MMTEPVTLDQLKAQLRLTHSRQDDFLASLIISAREIVEGDTWLSLVPRTWTITRRRFPFGDEAILLPKPPLRTVTSVTYFDNAGDSVELTGFRVDSLHMPGSIEPAYGQTWPWTQDGPAGVTVVYECGFATAADVPESLKQAMLMIAAQMFHSDSPVEIAPNNTLDRILRCHRVRSLQMLESVWTPKSVYPKYPGALPLWNGMAVF